ncbi:MAG: LAGLIDADG family homing endonuclease [Candidatus Aminicenantales bacterium]
MPWLTGSSRVSNYKIVMLKLRSLSLSQKENRKRIVLPDALTPKLAEDVGWLIGDGSMNIYNKNYLIKIAGDPTEEKTFYDDIIAPTKKGLFNLFLKARDLSDGSYGLIIYSKALLLFYNQIIELPLSPKNNMTIPEIIKKAGKNTLKACIRGVFDTDGVLTFHKKRKALHYYPSIELENISKNLINDLKRILEDFGFKVYAEFNLKRPTSVGYPRMTHRLFLYGQKNLERWIREIGFRNQKHLTKYMVWEKFGFCPTYTTLEERYRILNGKLSPYNL